MALPDYNYQPGLDRYRGYTAYRQARPGNNAMGRNEFLARRQQPTVTPSPPVTAPIVRPNTAPVADPNRDYTAHPFFDPNSSYVTNPDQRQGFEPGSMPYNIYASEQSPEGYYYGVMNDLGFGGLDAKSQAAQGMYRDYARGYQAAKLKNAELWFPEYMGMQDVAANVRNLSNRQLGIDENLYAGRDRWTLRGY